MLCMNEPQVCIVAAIGKNRELGLGNKLLWHIPDDLKRFRDLTAGHPVVMGRKTFESIVGYAKGPLPRRQNIVVTRDSAWSYAGVLVANSVESAIEQGKALDPEVFIIGGAQIYSAALPFVDKLYLTLIDDSKEADSFFPEYEEGFRKIVSEEKHEWNGLRYRWLDLERL